MPPHQDAALTTIGANSNVKLGTVVLLLAAIAANATAVVVIPTMTLEKADARYVRQDVNAERWNSNDAALRSLEAKIDELRRTVERANK